MCSLERLESRPGSPDTGCSLQMEGPQGGIKDQGWGNWMRKWEAVDKAPGRSDTKQSRNVFKCSLYGPRELGA